jgi:uncharacterized membrane protein
MALLSTLLYVVMGVLCLVFVWRRNLKKPPQTSNR